MTPSRALTVIGCGGFQPAASSLRDVGLLERSATSFRRRVAQLGDRRHVGLRVDIDEVVAGGRQADVVVRIGRRQQLLILPSMPIR